MKFVTALVFGIFVGAVRGAVFYNQPGYYGYEPEYKMPVGYPKYTSGPAGYGPYSGYRSGLGDYGRQDLLRKNVHDVQESGLESSKGALGEELVRVDTKGGEGYRGLSSARDSTGRQLTRAGAKEGFGKAADGFYGAQTSGGFKKGHSNTGFHKAYTNVESGKDHSYVDEDFNQGGELFGKKLGDAYDSAGHQAWEKAHSSGTADRAVGGHEQAGSGLHSAGQHKARLDEAGRRGKIDSRDLLDASHKTGRQWDDHVSTGLHAPVYYY